MRRASFAQLLVVLSAGACMSSGSGRSIARRELTEEAKRAIEQERALGAVAGSPTTVAVLPLRFSGSDSALRPLERGFAELLATDLSRSSKLTVVERARVQALLDRVALRHGERDAKLVEQAERDALLEVEDPVQSVLAPRGAAHLGGRDVEHRGIDAEL